MFFCCCLAVWWKLDVANMLANLGLIMSVVFTEITVLIKVFEKRKKKSLEVTSLANVLARHGHLHIKTCYQKKEERSPEDYIERNRREREKKTL